MKAIKAASVAHKKLDAGTMMIRNAVGKKEKASKKDSGVPARFPNAFFVFMEDFRKSYKDNLPDNKSVVAVFKAGRQKWSSMSESEKLPYVNTAAKRRQKYEKALEEHRKIVNGLIEAVKQARGI